MSTWKVAALGATLAYGCLYYLGRTWGSTPDERRRELPGDDIVPEPSFLTDHAVSIDAPPDCVWPWLVQMGWGRGGFYTYRWVDRLLFPANAPSAERILPGLQDLKPGDIVPDGAPETGCFYVVRELEARRHLVLHSTTHLPPQLRNRPDVALSWTWTFALKSESGGGTRLHFRARGSVRSRWLLALAHLLIVPADFLMARSMCLGLKRRAEGLRASGWRPDAAY